MASWMKPGESGMVSEGSGPPAWTLASSAGGSFGMRRSHEVAGGGASGRRRSPNPPSREEKGSRRHRRRRRETAEGEGHERRRRRDSQPHEHGRSRRRDSEREREVSMAPPPTSVPPSEEKVDSFKEWMRSTRPNVPLMRKPDEVDVRLEASTEIRKKDFSGGAASEISEGSGRQSKKICLGKTQGLMAVGAWAAREEIADLLERGHTKEEILSAVREGVEHGPMLQSSNTLGQPHKVLSKESKGESKRSNEGKFSVVSEKIPQAAVPSGAPTWVRPGPSASGAFKKRAQVPEIGGTSVGAGSDPGYVPTSLEDLEDSDEEDLSSDREQLTSRELSAIFKKRAEMPRQEVEPIDEEKKKALQKSFPRRKNPSEQHLLETYFEKAREVFEGLTLAGVAMDIVDLIYETGKDDYDEARFRIYTEPKSVGTGLRYSRLMILLLEFYKNNWGETCETPKITGKEVVLKFIEHKIQENCGFRTPKAILYALEYFGVIFGFQDPGSRLPRCRKLADDYAAKAPPRSPAKHISIEFMQYLERAILSEGRSLAERLVCGKLRLCAQASIRHDDLERTPLSTTEWIRLKGGVEIIGMRACAPVTKSGVRPWVASYLAVSPDNDLWMSKFVELVIQAHGDSWSTREFFCPGFADDVTPLGFPSTWGADVTIIKRMLADDLAKGYAIPVDADSIEHFRWHGSKASMPTIMAHFGTKAKVIRYQGNWSKKADAMPDVYLREAQVIVLKGQVEVLERIRAGETLDTLEGVPLGAKGSDAGPLASQETERVPNPAGSARAESKVAVAMASTLVADAPEDEGFCRGKLPVAEDFPQQLADGGFKLFHERGLRLEEALELEKKEDKLVDIETVSSLMDPFEDLLDNSSEDSEAPPEEKDMELLPYFIFSGGRGKKLHKPGLNQEEDELQRVEPKCRAPGKVFEILDLSETLPENVALCKRCFGVEEKCNSVCTYKIEKGGRTLRCGRRCCLCCAPGTGDGDTRPHSCALHLSANMDDEL